MGKQRAYSGKITYRVLGGDSRSSPSWLFSGKAWLGGPGCWLLISILWPVMNFIGFNLFTKLFHGLISRQLVFALVLPLRKQGRKGVVAPDLSATTRPARACCSLVKRTRAPTNACACWASWLTLGTCPKGNKSGASYHCGVASPEWKLNGTYMFHIWKMVSWIMVEPCNGTYSL